MSLNKRIPPASGTFAGPFAAIFEFTGGGTNDVTVSGMSFEPDYIKFRRKSESSFEYYMHKLEANTWWHTTQEGNSSGNSFNSNVSNGSNQVIQWNSDGFTIKGNSSTSSSVNASGENFIGLALYAGNESVTNNDGNVASTVMAFPDAGFSIVKFTSGGSSTTVGHGLGAAPEISVMTYGSGSNPSGQYSNTSYYDNVLHNEMRRGQGWLAAHSSTDNNTITHNTNTITVGNTQVMGGDNGVEYTLFCFVEKPHQQMGMWLGNFSDSTRTVYSMTDSADPKYVRVIFVDSGSQSSDIYQPLYDSVSGGLYRFDDILQYSHNSTEYNLNFAPFGEYVRLDWTSNRLLTNSDWYPINGRADLNYHYYGIFWGGDNCEIL